MLYTKQLQVQADAILLAVPNLDLVDECDWEDHVETISLEEAGFEEEHSQPVFGLRAQSGSVSEYINWWHDKDADQ
jgi:hypothetical protein